MALIMISVGEHHGDLEVKQHITHQWFPTSDELKEFVISNTNDPPVVVGILNCIVHN